MGGIGSGSGYRSGGPTCESYHAIDVRTYARKGLLTPGTIGWSRWYHGDQESGSIRFIAGHDSITLKFRTQPYGSEWEDVEQRIELRYTTPHFGGRRPWFQCPRCWRSCAKLYGGARFYCRKCWRLSYQSQREDRCGRMLSRAQKVRMRLGGSPNMTMPFPWKPKGMHWQTYWRIRARAETLDAATWGATAEKLGISV